jgi:hypothetical protein
MARPLDLEREFGHSIEQVFESMPAHREGWGNVPELGAVSTDLSSSRTSANAPGRSGTASSPYRLLGASTLTTAGLLASCVLLLTSGAPATSPNLGRVANALDDMSVSDVLLWTLLILLGAFITYPLQNSLVRLLEGYWDDSALGRTLAALGLRLHRRRLERLIEIAYDTDRGRHRGRQRLAQRRLETAYPDEDRLLPTRLGNALRSFEDHAGQRYGLDTITMLPRLYPYLSDHVSSALDDLRDQLDIAARLCVTLLLATVVSAALLLTHGWWLLVPAATAILAWVAYRSAVQAAIAYGKEIAVAFDLHRFEMVRGLHFPLPSAAEEVAFNRRITKFLLNQLTRDDPAAHDYPDYQHPDELRDEVPRTSLLSPVP